MTWYLSWLDVERVATHQTGKEAVVQAAAKRAVHATTADRLRRPRRAGKHGGGNGSYRSRTRIALKEEKLNYNLDKLMPKKNYFLTRC